MQNPAYFQAIFPGRCIPEPDRSPLMVIVKVKPSLLKVVRWQAVVLVWGLVNLSLDTRL